MKSGCGLSLHPLELGVTTIRFLASLFIGMLAGLVGGLVGVGGGVLMVPLMVEWLKLRQHEAHGTSLVAIVFTGVAGSVAYGLQGSVDLFAALLLASTAMLSARQGARFAASLAEWKLKRSFGGFLLFVASLLALKSFLPTLFPSNPLGVSGISHFVKAGVLLLTGLITGFLSGMMGVGGGLLMVPAMVLLVGITQHTAQGTSLLVMVPAGMVGAWTHWRLGNVVASLVPGLILGVLAGTQIGAHFAHALPENHLRLFFAAFAGFMSLRYLRTPPDQEQSVHARR